MNIGETIKLLRKKRGISQVEFALRCNISQTSLSQIEQGKKKPHESTLESICQELEIPVMYLYFLSFDERDVPQERKEAYKMIGPSIKSLILQLFGESETNLNEVNR